MGADRMDTGARAYRGRRGALACGCRPAAAAAGAATRFGLYHLRIFATKKLRRVTLTALFASAADGVTSPARQRFL